MAAVSASRKRSALPAATHRSPAALCASAARATRPASCRCSPSSPKRFRIISKRCRSPASPKARSSSVPKASASRPACCNSRCRSSECNWACRKPPRRTLCATHSRRTSSPAAVTCVRSRSCSATPRFRPPSATPRLTRRNFSPSITRRIPAPVSESPMTVTIRPIRREDAEAVVGMQKEFGAYLISLGDHWDPKFTEQRYLEDGFGANPAFHGFIAEEAEKPQGDVPLGYLLYTPTYDSDTAQRGI